MKITINESQYYNLLENLSNTIDDEFIEEILRDENLIPDYSYEGKGLRIDGATDGKPAAAAGIQKGDVLVKMGDTDIKDIQAYMKALSEHKKGDTIPVKVLRDGKEVELKVTF